MTTDQFDAILQRASQPVSCVNNMSIYKEIFNKIIDDPRYQANLDWGKPRSGHQEGTVRAHIQELEENLTRFEGLSDEDYWKLKILIHTHDTFKKDAERRVPINHPRSHASLARDFLAEFCQDEALLNIVQYHDEPYALWRIKDSGKEYIKRLEALLRRITDLDTFFRFLRIDGETGSKDQEPLNWFSLLAHCLPSKPFEFPPAIPSSIKPADRIATLLKENNAKCP